MAVIPTSAIHSILSLLELLICQADSVEKSSRYLDVRSSHCDRRTTLLTMRVCKRIDGVCN